jgi:hypothetical protein
MGRPIKTGLDYFPLDVNIDDNLELIEAEHGLQGFAIVIKLWQKIYSNGYYIEWNSDTALLFSKKINSELTLINSVINSCFNRNILNKTLYEKYNILTSSGIQKRFLMASTQSKRKSICFYSEYTLVNSEFTGLITEFIELTQEKSAQSKVKESKEELLLKIQDEFYNSLKPFVPEFDKKVVREFYDYWSEPNTAKTKIRKQLEKTWDTKKRLVRWLKNEENKFKKTEQPTLPLSNPL